MTKPKKVLNHTKPDFTFAELLETAIKRVVTTKPELL